MLHESRSCFNGMADILDASRCLLAVLRLAVREPAASIRRVQQFDGIAAGFDSIDLSSLIDYERYPSCDPVFGYVDAIFLGHFSVEEIA